MGNDDREREREREREIVEPGLDESPETFSFNLLL